MERIHHADAIFQNSRFLFNQSIRRQAAIAFSDAHRAAGWKKAQANFLRRLDRIFQPHTVGV